MVSVSCDVVYLEVKGNETEYVNNSTKHTQCTFDLYLKSFL